MKKLLLCTFAIMISLSLLAQKQKQKNNNSGNPKQEARNVVLGNEKKNTGNKPRNEVDVIWDGTKDGDGGGPKYSKNQPAKVRAAFAGDYPNARNVSWSKYRGDWTATFSNGITRSVAVYHANGERRDTRTVVQRAQLPKIILEEILKKRRNAQLGDFIKIEVPKAVKDIFRIKTTEGNTTRFLFYNADGKEVSYDY